MRRWGAAGPVLALAALAVASSAALWRPIGVFAFPSLHFMAHPGFVTGAWLVVATAAWAALRGRVVLLTASFATPVGVFLGVATSGPWVFPAARVTLWGASLALAALWLIVGWRWFFGQAGPRALCGLLLGGLAGLMLVLAERPPPAATRPVGGSLPPVG